jgi:hypothetical protein
VTKWTQKKVKMKKKQHFFNSAEFPFKNRFSFQLFWVQFVTYTKLVQWSRLSTTAMGVLGLILGANWRFLFCPFAGSETNGNNLWERNTRYQRQVIELLSRQHTDWTHYFPAARIILFYKFTDLIGSGKLIIMQTLKKKHHPQRESKLRIG